MAARLRSAIRSAHPARACSSRCCMRCRSAMPRRASPRSASAAAWVSPCAWLATEPSPRRNFNMARVALVTGGTRGIGAAISKALKAAGYKVAASYAGNDAVAEKFKAETGIPVYKWDVSSFDACAAGIKKVEADLGPVDVLVNNAGITKDGAFHKMTLEQWNAVINTNLGSLFNMTRQVIEGMRARKFGRVINISSINGQKGQFGQVNYSAAKAGDIGFTKALALENAKGGITVNAI